MSIHPFHLVLSALAHKANREQAAIIDYRREENRVVVRTSPHISILMIKPGRERTLMSKDWRYFP